MNDPQTNQELMDEFFATHSYVGDEDLNWRDVHELDADDEELEAQTTKKVRLVRNLPKGGKAMLRPKTSTRRFAILARVSTREQMTGHSLAIQKKQGAKYIERCKGTLVQVYEAQESATTEERSTLTRALADAGKVFTDLVVQDISRLSRNPAVTFSAITRLSKVGVKLHDFRGPLPFDTPEGELRLMMESVIGRFTSRQGVNKSIDARLHVLQSGGIAAGRPPWGRKWVKETRKFAVIPERLRQIKRAYQLIGKRNYSLARAAVELSIPKSSLKKAILQGALTKVTQRLAGETFDFQCPRLLDSFQQKLLLRRIAANAVIRPSIKGEYLLQSLVRCANCGGSMSGQTSIKGGYRYSVYRHAPTKMLDECTWSVPVELLDNHVLTACAEVVKSGSSLQTAITAELTNSRADASRLSKRRKDLTHSIRSAKAQLERLVDALQSLPKKSRAQELTLHRINRIERSLRSSELELQEVLRELQTLRSPKIDADDIAAKIRALYWASGAGPKVMLSFEQRRTFIRAMVGRTKTDSQTGIFVRMVRRKGASKKDVYWRYQLRGNIAVTEKFLDHTGDSYPEVALTQEFSDTTVAALAAVANSTKGIRIPNVQTSKKCS